MPDTFNFVIFVSCAHHFIVLGRKIVQVAVWRHPYSAVWMNRHKSLDEATVCGQTIANSYCFRFRKWAISMILDKQAHLRFFSLWIISFSYEISVQSPNTLTLMNRHRQSWHHSSDLNRLPCKLGYPLLLDSFSRDDPKNRKCIQLLRATANSCVYLILFLIFVSYF